MSDFRPPMCEWCVHRIRGTEAGYACKAFPEGIPEEIITSSFDHRKPFPDDNGIRFKPTRDSLADFSVFDDRKQ